MNQNPSIMICFNHVFLITVYYPQMSFNVARKVATLKFGVVSTNLLYI